MALTRVGVSSLTLNRDSRIAWQVIVLIRVTEYRNVAARTSPDSDHIIQLDVQTMSEPHLTTLSDSRPPLLLPDTTHCASSATMATLKRPASPSFENDDQPKRKRIKEQPGETAMVEKEAIVSGKAKLAEDLALELQCGCCSKLVYNPVVVLPCQHFFCGRCVSSPFLAP